MKARSSKLVLLYDIDAANPYGRELAALLSAIGPVEVLVPVNTEWAPEKISTRRILPSTNASSILAQVFRLLHGSAVLIWAALTRATIVVVMTRSWYDELTLTLAAFVGARVVVIAHDPVPKQPLPWHLNFSRKMLWSHAGVLVTHSKSLAEQATAFARRTTRVVPHLPFVEYAAWMKKVAPDAKLSAGSRLVLVGRMRADKGLDRLPAIFRLVPEENRKRISLSFTGWGNCDEVVAELRLLVDVTRAPSESLLSDVEVAQELASSDILIAPYQQVSASGSIVLALCRGLKVIAYDAGSLADVVAPDGLVPLGDESAFAQRIDGALGTLCCGPAQPIEVWKKASLEAWSEIFDCSRRSDAIRTM